MRDDNDRTSDRRRDTNREDTLEWAQEDEKVEATGQRSSNRNRLERHAEGQHKVKLLAPEPKVSPTKVSQCPSIRAKRPGPRWLHCRVNNADDKLIKLGVESYDPQFDGELCNE
jgi:hypothetical protein